MAAADRSLELEWLEGSYAIWRLEPDAPVPAGAAPGAVGEELLSLTRTGEEFSVVGLERRAPEAVPVSRGWSALRVRGELEHSLTGVLASLASPLATAGVPVFALSTFDTDYLLVPTGSRDDVSAALRAAGHALRSL